MHILKTPLPQPGGPTATPRQPGTTLGLADPRAICGSEPHLCVGKQLSGRGVCTKQSPAQPTGRLLIVVFWHNTPTPHVTGHPSVHLQQVCFQIPGGKQSYWSQWHKIRGECFLWSTFQAIKKLISIFQALCIFCTFIYPFSGFPLKKKAAAATATPLILSPNIHQKSAEENGQVPLAKDQVRVLNH